MFLLVCALLISATGCGSRGPEIKGTVTLDGTPAAKVRLAFEPIGAGSMGGAVAVTDDSGAFEIVPHESTGQTLSPGKYGVTFSRKTDAQGNVPIPEDYGQLEAAGQLKESIPEKYLQKPGTPPVEIKDIVAGTNELKFELKP